MASTLETRFLSGIRDMPLSSLTGHPPTRIPPVGDSPPQDDWACKANIWQTTPRFFEYMPKDQKQSVFPNKSNRAVVADVPTSVAGALTRGDQNISVSTGNGVRAASSTTIPSSRPSGALLSPTRLRSNGVSASEPNTAMMNLGRPSLLLGSAPDIEPSHNFPVSTGFGNHQMSTTGRNFRHINVEDAEEFVPLYLQGQGGTSHPAKTFSHNNASYHHHNSTNTNINDSSIATTQRNDPFSMSNFHPRMWNNTARGDVAREENDSDETYRSNSGTSHSSHISSDKTISYDVQIRPLNRNYSGRGLESIDDRKSSNLRPDVASYEPVGINTNAHLYSSQRSNILPYSYGSADIFHANSIDMQPQSMNGNAIYANSSAFHMNSLAENPNFANHLGPRSQQFPNSNTMRYDVLDPRYRNFDGDMSYRSLEHAAPGGVNSRFSNKHAVPSQYLTSSAPNAYTNEQFEYDPESSRVTPYQQPYTVDPVTGTVSYVDGRVFPKESGHPEAPRSKLLEEFRTYYKSKKYELKDIYGYIVEFSGDQTGSRFIQTKLEQANSDEKEQIFMELQTNAKQLMSDVFGNYVIQKMFEYGNQAQKKALASIMQGYVYKLSTHAYGCRCVQKALEHVLTDQQAALIKELDGHVLEVVESQHGNHVIQKAIECISQEQIQFIVDAHRNQVVRLARHIYGCRIVQRMLEYCAPHARRVILDELHCAIPTLIDDQYGNYVIQCIIQKCSPGDRYRVIGLVQQRLLYYSMHKFASNVVEKAIQYADDNQRVDMVRTLTSPTPDNGMQSPVLGLLKDQYGNYVIQTVLRTIQGPAKKALADEVRHHLNLIGKLNRGKQITAMADTLAAITSDHSPSSISTGPHTPRTPTSLNSGASGTPMTKTIDMVPLPYSTRDQPRGVYHLKPLHT